MTEGKSNKLPGAELARRTGVSTDTLRHYETKGVIKRPQRQSNGYRIYPAETLPRVQLVRRALAIGFTLDELAEILRVRDMGGAPCHRVRELAKSKLKGVEERVRELLILRDELRGTLKEWDRKLAATPKNQRSGLLEKLAPTAALQPQRGKHFATTAKTNRKPTNKKQ